MPSTTSVLPGVILKMSKTFTSAVRLFVVGPVDTLLTRISLFEN